MSFQYPTPPDMDQTEAALLKDKLWDVSYTLSNSPRAFYPTINQSVRFSEMIPDPTVQDTILLHLYKTAQTLMAVHVICSVFCILHLEMTQTTAA